MSDGAGKPPGGPPPPGGWPLQPGQPQVGQQQHFPQQPQQPHYGQQPQFPQQGQYPPPLGPGPLHGYPGQPPPQGFAPPAPLAPHHGPLHGFPGQPPPQGFAPTVPLAEAGMFKRSLGRALRLRIEPEEVSPKERAALLAATPPITVPYLQAFLAWRRSVLFLVAIALIPLTALRLHDAMSGELPDELRFIQLIPAAAEGLLCLVCLYQLKNWTHWRQQRRALLKVWVLFMAAPFIVFLVPVDSILQGMIENQVGGVDQWGDVAVVDAAAVGAAVIAVKTTIAIYALLTLAPKAVSLLAGTIRAGIVTKMLFPGTSGPGWIVVLSTPLYTLFVFTLLIVPYQLTGSGWYVGAMIGLAAAQLALGRAGYALAKPTTHDEAVKLVAKARTAYLLSMLVFAACLLVALGALAAKLGASTIVSTVLSFEANVMILTLIGSDLVITALARSRGLQAGTTHLVEESNAQLSAFVGEE